MADSGASASIISWDLAKKVNIAQKSKSTKELDELGEGDTIEQAPDEAEARPDKAGDDLEEEEAKANEGGDKKWTNESRFSKKMQKLRLRMKVTQKWMRRSSFIKQKHILKIKRKVAKKWVRISNSLKKKKTPQLRM